MVLDSRRFICFFLIMHIYKRLCIEGKGFDFIDYGIRFVDHLTILFRFQLISKHQRRRRGTQ